MLSTHVDLGSDSYPVPFSTWSLQNSSSLLITCYVIKKFAFIFLKGLSYISFKLIILLIKSLLSGAFDQSFHHMMWWLSIPLFGHFWHFGSLHLLFTSSSIFALFNCSVQSFHFQNPEEGSSLSIFMSCFSSLVVAFTIFQNCYPSLLETFESCFMGFTEQMHLLCITWSKMLDLIILSHQISFLNCQLSLMGPIIFFPFFCKHFLGPFLGCKDFCILKKILKNQALQFHSSHPKKGNYVDWHLDSARLFCLAHCHSKYLSDLCNLSQGIVLKNTFRYSVVLVIALPYLVAHMLVTATAQYLISDSAYGKMFTICWSILAWMNLWIWTQLL